VKTVITVGRLKQGVVEDLAAVRSAIRAQGGIVEQPVTRLAGKTARPVHVAANTHSSGRRPAALVHRGRVRVTFREAAAETGTIHLRPITHDLHARKRSG
jgi:hypothetical protein